MFGLYIHIPFCLAKCNYCDFISYPITTADMNGYEKLIEKEIQLVTNETGKLKIDTIFIGGGTPSLLPSIDYILEISSKAFDISDDVEITIEANPATVNKEKLRAYLKNGINRISFGVQSFNDNELKLIGRKHNSSDAVNSYNDARNTGFRNINLDLIYGLPSQSLDSWKETLDKAIELNPEHISCYSLILEDGTKLYEMVKSKQIDLPDEEKAFQMYDYTKAILNNAGYTRYEVSNYTHSGYECRHNINYWDNGEYLGLGCAAHSHLDNKRLENYSCLNDYRASLNNNIRPIKNIIENNKSDEMFDTIMMGLRKTKGINIREFEKRFNESIYITFGSAINKNILLGTIIQSNGNLYLSDRGFDIMNTVLLDFIIIG